METNNRGAHLSNPVSVNKAFILYFSLHSRLLIYLGLNKRLDLRQVYQDRIYFTSEVTT